MRIHCTWECLSGTERSMLPPGSVWWDKNGTKEAKGYLLLSSSFEVTQLSSCGFWGLGLARPEFVPGRSHPGTLPSTARNDASPLPTCPRPYAHHRGFA